MPNLFYLKSLVHALFFIYLYKGHSINYVTTALFVKTTCAIFMYDTSLKRSSFCRYTDILHKDNHTLYKVEYNEDQSFTVVIFAIEIKHIFI